MGSISLPGWRFEVSYTSNYVEGHPFEGDLFETLALHQAKGAKYLIDSDYIHSCVEAHSQWIERCSALLRNIAFEAAGTFRLKQIDSTDR